MVDVVKIGDFVQVTMPNWKDEIKVYRFKVEELIDGGRYILSPLDQGKEPFELEAIEFPWRRIFTRSSHGLKVGWGDEAKTYPIRPMEPIEVLAVI